MGQLKTKGELEKRHIEIWDQLDQIEKRAQNEKREMTAEEAAQYDALLREDVRNQHDMQFLLTSKQLEGFREQQNKNAQFRELLKRCKDDRKDFSAALETRETPANTVLKPLEMSPGREAACRAVFGTWGFFRTMHGKTAPSC